MNLTQLIGHFHPLLVHLPIGILILGAILEVLTRFERWQSLRAVNSLVLLVAAISAILACVAGYCLSLNGDYDPVLLANHQWTGIGLAAVSSLSWAIEQFMPQKNRLVSALSWLITLGFLGAAGHYGGSLTHGKNYLFDGVFETKKNVAVVDSTQNNHSQIIDNQNIKTQEAINTIGEAAKTAPQYDAAKTAMSNAALSFKNDIQPILEQRCYNCHGPNKSKGDLRLDSPEFIQKGGENGTVLIGGKPEKSTLYQYLVLPLDDDNHMPPDGKPQPTVAQIQRIHAWIAQGAAFSDAVARVASTPSVSAAPMPTTTEAPLPKAITVAPLPTNVAAANAQAIEKLKRQNIVVAPFGAQSNYLTANFVNVKNYNGAMLADLQSVKNQLIRLKLSNQPVADKDLARVADLKNVTHLYLDRTSVGDAGLAYLKNLPRLEYLNIYGTKVTDKGLQTLAACSNLKVIYLWETNVTDKGIADLQKILRGATIEKGNARFPKIDSVKQTQ